MNYVHEFKLIGNICGVECDKAAPTNEKRVHNISRGIVPRMRERRQANPRFNAHDCDHQPVIVVMRHVVSVDNQRLLVRAQAQIVAFATVDFNAS